MGNKLTRKRQMVDEKYTRPQGLYQHRDVDYKKLRKLILDSKLAPCYPGNEECTFDLEECPICFLYYPSLNRSRCCMKGICTECFLRMKPPHSTRPTQCPFCKTSNYAVEYHGIMSKEEKGMEQVEEQRVIEAKIRMRQQELLDEEERMQWKGINSSCRISSQGGIECHDVASSSLAVPSFGIPVEGDGTTSSQESFVAPTVGQSSNLTHNRDDEFDFDLEEIMLMEAIWLSIQETGSQRNPPHGAAAPPESFVREDHHLSSVSVDAPSPSGGLACAIAAIVEHQVNGDTSSSSNRNMPEFNIIPDPSGFSNEEELVARNYTQNSWIEVSPNSGRAVSMQERGWGIDQESETVEAGACYTSSDGTGEAGLAAFPLPDGIGDRFQSNISGPIIPESFEEQMMLAMAVSLAEARARTNAQEVAWL